MGRATACWALVLLTIDGRGAARWPLSRAQGEAAADLLGGALPPAHQLASLGRLEDPSYWPRRAVTVDRLGVLDPADRLCGLLALDHTTTVGPGFHVTLAGVRSTMSLGWARG